MRVLTVIFVFVSLLLQAQDKLFFSDGTVKKGIIVTITKDAVLFKDTDTSDVQQIKKSELIMSENYRGVRFIFYKDENVKPTSTFKKNDSHKNTLGVQPLAVFVGRGTIVYERYTKDHKIGFVFPFSITFDPFGSLYNSKLDTNKNTSRRITGVNFIAGADVNFYLGNDDDFTFFIGPRFRYGTDLFLRGIEAYSLQTQVGWRLGAPEDMITQHLSLGFGFANVLSTFSGPLVHPNRIYGWYSLNYRIGINW